MSEARMSPIAERRAGKPASRGVKALLVLCVACAPGISSAASAPSVINLSGKILGLVTDAAGVPQMGAAVTLLTQQDKFFDRALTDEKGAFSFDGLAAGAYSIRVSLASFLPVSKTGILVQPGLRTLLNVSLRLERSGISIHW